MCNNEQLSLFFIHASTQNFAQMNATNNSNFKVVILGGGLVGALAAVTFSNRGYAVQLFEKRPGIDQIDEILERKTLVQANQSTSHCQYEELKH
jgi:heterodisulfide reductase subunit A-like polyferredoxin